MDLSLHALTDYEAFLKDDQFWHDFNVRAKDATNEDLYYLLQAFLEMALARDETTDWDFIKTLFIHIFFVSCGLISGLLEVQEIIPILDWLHQRDNEKYLL